MTVVERFRELSAGRQMLLVLLGVALIGGLLFAVYFTALKTPYAVLVADARPSDAAAIVTQLDKTKTQYQLRDGGHTILVPTDKLDRTRIDLASSDVLSKGTVGFELFNKSDMGVTEFAQKINYQRALQGELARTIMSLDSVQDARVHLALAEPTIFRDDQKPPKGSVTVVTRPGQSLSSATIRGIQRLVAAAVPDLDIANVAVLDGHGAIVSEASSEAPGPQWGDQKQAIEDAYEAKVRQALAQEFPAVHFDITVLARMAGAISADQREHRDFPLEVVVVEAGPLADEKAAVVRKLVAQQVGADPTLGDNITVSVAAQPAAAAATPAVPKIAPQLLNATDLGALILVVLFALVAGAVLLVRAGAPAYRTLSAAERQSYARRLKDLLDSGVVNEAPRPNTALRRLVSQLARANPQDVGLILSDLNSEQRGTVAALLKSCVDSQSVASADTAITSKSFAAPIGSIAGLSDGLQRRLAPHDKDEGGAAANDRMTLGARAALQECAEDLLSKDVLRRRQPEPAQRGWWRSIMPNPDQNRGPA